LCMEEVCVEYSVCTCHFCFTIT